MILAVEDIISETVARKLINNIRPEIQIDNVIGNKGRGYLQSKARELNRVARSLPILLLADTDRLDVCPADLISNWIPGRRQRGLLFRFAVTEIESWVIADRDAFSDFFSILLSRVPTNTDTIFQPKEFIINLAKKSRSRKIKSDLIPREGGTALVGPLYNAHMIDFVINHWNPQRAANNSNSLNKAINRLRSFSL